MAVLLSNNATSTLAASINTSVTSISIQSGDATKFPTPGAGDWFPVTVVDSAGNMETMRCTARSGATLTVTRAQEGTTAKAFASGSRIDLRLTAAAANELYKASAALAAIAALAVTDNNFIVGNGTTWVAESGAAARASLGADNAANLTTGVIPSARLTGAYTNITDFTMSGTLTVANAAPVIRLQDTTASAYDGRLRLDANNLYVDGSSDGSTYAEVLRFELDTKIGYMSQLFLTSSAEAIRLAAPSAGQDPYISFYQAAVRTAYIQYQDGAGNAAGLKLQNDFTTGDSILILTNDGGVSGCRYYNNGNNYEVYHSGNLSLSSLGGVPTSRTVTAGNGLTGGGALSGNITVTLGTPGTLTATSGNAVTSTSHTHDVDWGGGAASLGAGGIGTYVWAQRVGNTNGYAFGATISGANLEPASGISATNGVALSGTWRCMGAISAGATSTGSFAIWLRIS
ncbi:hypothetical protein [Ensifer sp. ENS04]|uniref:hypothetical protein n=1 Tax=Ensifer sp. ENS04 TaxID=2769281 RepID=UPI001FEF8DE3|nr:hypothetical protein [Ensifer sp. ENS04]